MFSLAASFDPEISLQPPEFSPVKWLEGTVMDDSAPKYLIPSQRSRGALDREDMSSLVVKIGDLGGGKSISLSSVKDCYD
jgi:serine/threonine-protein kinase SRPK3